ncbi:MAG: LamG domain-containing protein, partial [Bacilli bacterium]
MTKLGKKGFMLAETLVVSSVLLITFTFLYVQFFDVLNKYTIYSDYDNIDKLYNVYNLKEFVKEDNLDSIINQLQNNIGNNTPYVDLTNCSKFSETEYCSTLFNQLNVKRLIFTNYNLNLFSNWNGITHNFNKKLQTYINTLQANYGELYNKFYRIIVEYKDSSFSTGRLSAGNVTDIDTDWSEWQSLGSTSNVDYINQNDVHYMYPTDVRSVGYMDFDGVNDTIQVPHSSSLSVNNTDEITEMAWVNPRAYVANGTIATKGLSYYFQIHSNGKVATYTYWDNGGVRTESSYFYSNNTVPLNEWTHVAFTEDSTGFRKIYINGELDNSGQFQASIWSESNTLRIGAETSSRYFNGKIRDVAIFN